MSQLSDLQTRTRSAGQFLFVAGALIGAIILGSQITGQTQWTDNAKSFAGQPRFWPAVSIISMVVGLGLHLYWLPRRRPRRADWVEARRWLEPVEYAGWFMAYVFLVPWIGFLPMSIALACALTWRLGYKSRKSLLLAALFAVATVFIFKGLLGVKIPGAAIYEFLPIGLRNLFILYL